MTRYFTAVVAVSLAIPTLSARAQSTGDPAGGRPSSELDSNAGRLDSDLETRSIDVDEWMRLGIASVLTPEAVPTRYRPEKAAVGDVTGRVAHYLSRWDEVTEATRSVVVHALGLIDTWKRKEAGELLVSGGRPTPAEERATQDELSIQLLSSTTARLSEVATAHTGSQTKEYVEVQGAPSEDLSALSIVAVEGAAGSSGDVAAVFSVGTTDDLGLWWTGFNTSSLPDVDVTLLLVEGQTPSVNDDLDTNDDGAFDSPPWSDVVDSVALWSGQGSAVTYSPNLIQPGHRGASGTPTAISRVADTGNPTVDWYRNDASGAGTGLVATLNSSSEALNTPGRLNCADTGEECWLRSSDGRFDVSFRIGLWEPSDGIQWEDSTGSGVDDDVEGHINSLEAAWQVYATDWGFDAVTGLPIEVRVAPGIAEEAFLTIGLQESSVRQTAFHELFHKFQFEHLNSFNHITTQAGTWLLEGAAQWAQHEANVVIDPLNVDTNYFEDPATGDPNGSYLEFMNATEDELYYHNAIEGAAPQYGAFIFFEYIEPATGPKGATVNAIYEELDVNGANILDAIDTVVGDLGTTAADFWTAAYEMQPSQFHNDPQAAAWLATLQRPNGAFAESVDLNDTVPTPLEADLLPGGSYNWQLSSASGDAGEITVVLEPSSRTAVPMVYRLHSYSSSAFPDPCWPDDPGTGDPDPRQTDETITLDYDDPVATRTAVIDTDCFLTVSGLSVDLPEASSGVNVAAFEATFQSVASVHPLLIGANNGAGTSHIVEYWVQEEGSLLVAGITSDGYAEIATPAGWTLLATGTGNQVRESLFYRVAPSPGQYSVDFATTVHESKAAHIFEITEWNGVDPPSVSGHAQGWSSSPDLGAVTTAWGTDWTLFLGFVGYDGSRASVTNPPTGYTLEMAANANVGVGQILVSRTTYASTSDPSPMTLSASRKWTGFTLAVPIDN